MLNKAAFNWLWDFFIYILQMLFLNIPLFLSSVSHEIILIFWFGAQQTLKNIDMLTVLFNISM